MAQCFRFEEPDLSELQTAISEQSPAEVNAHGGEKFQAYEDQAVQEISAAFEALQAAFAKATAVGTSHLDLAIGYHGEDDGDRYDDVRGVFWAVDGMQQLSPAGEKFKDIVAQAVLRDFRVVTMTSSRAGNHPEGDRLMARHRPPLLPKTRNEIYQAILDAARQHGQDDDPDHEVGDLQETLWATIGLLSAPRLRRLWYALLEQENLPMNISPSRLRRVQCVLLAAVSGQGIERK